MASASSSSSLLAHASLRRHEFSTEHLVSDFTLRNACVLYRTSSHRKKLQFVSLDGTTAIIHGFSEYRFGFIRLATVRTPTSLAEERTLRNSCRWNKLALAIPFTANNLYHALFHAVPAFESLTQHSNGNNVSFVPLLSNSAGVGRKLLSTRYYARAAVRAFNLDSSCTIASSLDDLLWREPCMCFERVHGSSAPFTPSAPSSAPRIRAWRSVVLHNVGSGAVPLSPTILYIRRSRTRVLLNEAELTRSLAFTSGVDPPHYRSASSYSNLECARSHRRAWAGSRAHTFSCGQSEASFRQGGCARGVAAASGWRQVQRPCVRDESLQAHVRGAEPSDGERAAPHGYWKARSAVRGALAATKARDEAEMQPDGGASAVCDEGGEVA